MDSAMIANRIHDILSEKAAMGMGVYAGSKTSRKKPCKKYRIVKKHKAKCKGSKSTKKACSVRGYRRKCRGMGELEDIMDLYGRGEGIRRRKYGSKTAKKKSSRGGASNPWIKFVKNYAKENNILYCQALAPAGRLWKKYKYGQK